MRKIILAIALLAPVPALALTVFLVSDWNKDGVHYCKYGNGAIITVGAVSFCPLTIQG